MPAATVFPQGTKAFLSMCLSSLGLGFIWGWTHLFSTAFSQNSGFTPLESSMLALTWKIGTAPILLVGVFLIRKHNFTHRGMHLTAALTALMGAFGTMLLVSPNTAYAVSPHKTASLLLIGVSYGLFVLLWAESLMPETLLSNVFRIGLSCVVAGFVFLIFSDSAGVVFKVATICLPILGVACQDILQYGIRPRNVRASVDYEILKAPRNICVSMILLSLSFGIFSQINAQGPQPQLWTYGSVVAGLIICYVAGRRLSSEGFNLAVSVFILFICACVVLAMLFSKNRMFMTGVVRIGWYILISSVFGLSGYVPAFKGRTASYKFCFGYLCYFLSLMLSEVLWILWPDKYLNFLLLAAILVVAATVSLFMGTGLKTRPPAEFATADNLEAPFERLFEERCAQISRDFGLTARESTVLIPLAKGYSLKAIAEQLSVSQNTVKAQVQSIYRKADVHSRSEFLSIMDPLKHKSI